MFTWRQLATGFALLGIGYMAFPPLTVMSRGATVVAGVSCWAVFSTIVATQAVREGVLLTGLKQTERRVYALLVICVSFGAMGRVAYPEYYFVPDWILIALLAFVIVGAVKLFAEHSPKRANRDTGPE